MKMRVVSIVFCLIAFTISLVLMFNIHNNEIKPNVVNPEQQNSGQQGTSDREEPVSDSSVKKLSADIMDFLETLPTEKDTGYSVKLENYIKQLKRSAEYLGTEKQDNQGKEYLLKVSQILDDMLNLPYLNTTELSSKISTALKDIDRLYPIGAADKEFYPDIDTDANGALTLAMVSTNNLKKSSDVFTISVGGGVILGDVVGASGNTFASETAIHNTNLFPLGGLSAVFASDDYSIVTLRNPLTDATNSVDSRTAVKGKAEYASMLSAAGIDAVNIASDHMRDYADQGVADTKTALSNAGVNFAVDSAINQEICEYNTKIGKITLISFNLNGTAVANNPPAVNSVVREAISFARSRNAVMIITMFSWKGQEDREISDFQVSVGRSAIDHGADLVIGTFPQYIQAMDVYKGKSIIYSNNNLLDGKTDILENQTSTNLNSLIISQDYTLNNGVLTASDITFYPVIAGSQQNQFMPELVFDSKADDIIEEFIDACQCSGQGIAKKTNKNKQDINYIKVNK